MNKGMLSTALTGHCPTLRNAAVRPVEGDIRCTSEINRQANSQIADFPDIRFPHFAHAAFSRAGCMVVAAVQHLSPKRSFNRDILGQIQTVLSLRDAGTDEMRTWTKPLPRQWRLLRVFWADFGRVHFEI